MTTQLEEILGKSKSIPQNLRDDTKQMIQYADKCAVNMPYSELIALYRTLEGHYRNLAQFAKSNMKEGILKISKYFAARASETENYQPSSD